MTKVRHRWLFVAAMITNVVWTSSSAIGAQPLAAQENILKKGGPKGVQIDVDDIAGLVASEGGPEAGVWVMAETDEFQTRFARIVVTDEQGRFLIPDLPIAHYDVWVRGYGLTDSVKVSLSPGNLVELQVSPAKDAETAAKIYPAAYWYAMVEVPSEDEVAHLQGGVKEYLAWMKNLGCASCHQLGNLATRTFPPAPDQYDSSYEKWSRRIQSGQAAPIMIRQAHALLGGVNLKYLAEWTDRIAEGELPKNMPERPKGKERNVVVTVLDWATPKAYMHDLSGTDRRNPTVNAFGPLYGAPESSTDHFPILDPIKITSTSFFAPVRDEDTPSTHDLPVIQPSPYWGNERIWSSKANAHNPMLDQEGRVWYTAAIRNPKNNPSWCREGSDHPSAKLFPTLDVGTGGRQLSVYYPDTGKYEFIDTCFGTHHLQFAEDKDNTLWTSGGGDVIGWVNTRKWFETKDAEQAVGWTAMVLDTNGNGRRDEYTEPDEAFDPKLDRRIKGNGQINNYGFYAVMPSPIDHSVWGSNTGYPGAIIRLDPGENPPATALIEKYNVPLPGYGVRGADIDRNGVVWVSLGSGHLGEFDRQKCKGRLNGPDAIGDQCPEGWTFHPLPGPSFANYPGYSVESSYYTWVDQHNTLGLGANVPIATGNLLDGLHALVDGEFVTLRVPYPLGFFTKGFEGRIDDPELGWKGRGLWVPSGDRTPWHKEDGVGSKPLVVHIQVRPNPLAK